MENSTQHKFTGNVVREGIKTATRENTESV